MDPQECLHPDFVLAAYQGGYFPMPDSETGEILWYNPDPRTVIPLDQFHVSRSLRRSAKHGCFEITFNTDFTGVIEGCAGREQTWISEEIKKAYARLFELGFAHSVEVRSDSGLLIGGLYGLRQGGVFNAESMFSRESDASKIAIWALISRMNACKMTLLEVQFMTPHLKSLGAIEIPRVSYLSLLAVALSEDVKFTGEPTSSRTLEA